MSKNKASAGFNYLIRTFMKYIPPVMITMLLRSDGTRGNRKRVDKIEKLFGWIGFIWLRNECPVGETTMCA
jgi:hypothetical protein